MITKMDKKTYFCIDGYSQHVVRLLKRNPFNETYGNRVRECPRKETCFGCHHESEIKLKPHYVEFDKLDKSLFNIADYEEAVSKVLIDARTKINNIKLKEELCNINSYNFIEKIQLLIKLCYFVSAEKKKINKSDKSELSKFPDLNIENVNNKLVENHIWALERKTHYCPYHLEFKRKINNNEKVSIRETCLGSWNCKYGCHYPEQLINISDFLTGVSDDPVSKIQMQNHIDFYQKKITDLEGKIKRFVINSKKSEEYKKRLEIELLELKEIQKRHGRQCHLTEQGLIPYNVWQEKLKLKKEEEMKNLIKEDDLTQKVRKKVVKKK
jgi:hypothetical protein